MTPAQQAPYTLLATIFWVVVVFGAGWAGEQIWHSWRNRR
jgi:membrane protein DedA with SNARE-associated domain